MTALCARRFHFSSPPLSDYFLIANNAAHVTCLGLRVSTAPVLKPRQPSSPVSVRLRHEVQRFGAIASLLGVGGDRLHATKRRSRPASSESSHGNPPVFLSGRGECHCGECKCHAGYVGDNCNCSTETASCVADDGQLCSGRGHCVCGRCQCTQPGAFGDACQKCPTCPDACDSKRECVECHLLKSGRPSDNQTCQQRVCKDEIVTVDALKTEEPGAVLCVYKTDDDCVMKFTYLEHASGRAVLTALREAECSGGPDALMVLLAVVGSILLVGVILLAAWKMVITVHDRREFARFQSARSRARYEVASNPLYKQPSSAAFVELDFDPYDKSYNGAVH
ncbi:integrin beta-5-like [Entelurus aequoreus]|uniref:integrin beta-5-like n=1 Tax=Entelurus aequoreus TaxID=161455 RepID=UPI002B1DEA16|nr:integrin beta-5-like [Entelurus aequoreus]